MTGTKTQRTWQCTRPKLATLLIDKGYTPEILPNPWQPSQTMWVFEITQELALIVEQYYASKGKPTPKAIAQQLGGK